MAKEKKELAVAALKDGTVIDHIPSEAVFKAVKILGLENTTHAVTIGCNLHSGRLGSKGIIKVADMFFDDATLNRIALIAPQAVVNIIRDYEVVEKAKSVAVVPYDGKWKDLGTWNVLTDELKERCIGNVVMDEKSENTHVINELEIPVMCIGAKDMVIAASCDGILVSEKGRSEHIKTYADRLQCRPMYEERLWGEYKVIDTVSFPDGYETLTRQLKIKAGKSISYQAHRYRDEVWTFIDGEGMLALDGKMTRIGRGDTVCIRKGMRHAVKAMTDLLFIEVQSGDLLVEEDVERFDWNWKS